MLYNRWRAIDILSMTHGHGAKMVCVHAWRTTLNAIKWWGISLLRWHAETKSMFHICVPISPKACRISVFVPNQEKAAVEHRFLLCKCTSMCFFPVFFVWNIDFLFLQHVRCDAHRGLLVLQNMMVELCLNQSTEAGHIFLKIDMYMVIRRHLEKNKHTGIH